jgi:hypothetical protein
MSIVRLTEWSVMGTTDAPPPNADHPHETDRIEGELG